MTLNRFLRQTALLLLLSFFAQSGFPQPLLEQALRVQNPAQTDVAARLKQSLDAGAEEKPVDPGQPEAPKRIVINTGNLNIPVSPNTEFVINADNVTLVPAGSSQPPQAAPLPSALPVEPPRALPAPEASSSSKTVEPKTVIPDSIGNPDPRLREDDTPRETVSRPSIPSARSAPSYSPTRPLKRLFLVATGSLLFITALTLVFSINQSGKSWKEFFFPSVTQIVPEQIESDINPPEQIDFVPAESASVFPDEGTFSGDRKVIQATSEQAGGVAHNPNEKLSPTEFEQQFYGHQIALLQGLADAQIPRQPDVQGIFSRLRIASVPGEDSGRNRIKAALARDQAEVDQAAAAVIKVLQQEQFTKTASRFNRVEITPATWKQYQQALNSWFAAQQRQLKRLVEVLAEFVEKDKQLLPGDNILLRDYYLDLTAHRLAEISVEEFQESRRLHDLMIRLGVELPFSALELPEGLGYGPSMVPAGPVPPDQLTPAVERPELLQKTLGSMHLLLAARVKRIEARLAFLDWEIKAYREMIGKDPQSRTAEYDRWNTELKITSRLSLVAQRRRILAQQDYLAVTGFLLQNQGQTRVDWQAAPAAIKKFRDQLRNEGKLPEQVASVFQVLFERAQSRLRDAEKIEFYERVFFYTGGTRDAVWRDASGKRVFGSYAFTGGIAYLDWKVRQEQRNQQQIERDQGKVADQFELRLALQRRQLAQLEYEQAVSDFSMAGLRRVLGIPTGAGSSGLTRAAPLVREPGTVALFSELGDLGEVADGLDLSDRMLTAAERQTLTVYGLPQDLPEPARKKAAATMVAQSQKAAAIAIRALWQQRIWAAQEADIARRVELSELETASDKYLDAVYQEELNSVRIFEMRRLTAELLMEGSLTLNQLLDLFRIPLAYRQDPAHSNRWFVFSNDADLLDFFGLSRWDLKARVGASDPAEYQRLSRLHDESVQLAIVAGRYTNGNRIDAKAHQTEIFAKYKAGTGWDCEKNSAEIAGRQWIDGSMTELLKNNNLQLAQGMPLFPANRPVPSAVPSVEDLTGLSYRGIPESPGYGGSVILDGASVSLTGGTYQLSMAGIVSALPVPLQDYQVKEHPLGQRWVPPERLQRVVVHDSNNPLAAAPSETVFVVQQGPAGSPFLGNGKYTVVRPGLLPIDPRVASAPVPGVRASWDPQAKQWILPDRVEDRQVIYFYPVRELQVLFENGKWIPRVNLIGIIPQMVSWEEAGRLAQNPERALGPNRTVLKVGDYVRDPQTGKRYVSSNGQGGFFQYQLTIHRYLNSQGAAEQEIDFVSEAIRDTDPPIALKPERLSSGSGLEEFLGRRIAEAPGFQAVVISAETAADCPELAGAEENTYQWGNLQLIVLSEEPAQWSSVITGWLSQPNLNLTLYGRAGDQSLSVLGQMLAGAEESIAIQGPYPPTGQSFSTLFKMILANLAGLEEATISDADLNQAAELLGLGKYV